MGIIQDLYSRTLCFLTSCVTQIMNYTSRWNFSSIHRFPSVGLRKWELCEPPDIQGDPVQNFQWIMHEGAWRAEPTCSDPPVSIHDTFCMPYLAWNLTPVSNYEKGFYYLYDSWHEAKLMSFWHPWKTMHDHERQWRALTGRADYVKYSKPEVQLKFS